MGTVVRGSPGDFGPGARQSGSRWFEGSGVELAGMAEGYGRELRPSRAARLRLDVTIHDDQEPTARDLSLSRRQRRPGRSKLRTTSRG
jgi:hypothetical protein